MHTGRPPPLYTAGMRIRCLLLFLVVSSVANADIEEEYDRLARQVVPRDGFPVLFDPVLTPVDKAKGIGEKEPVIGVVVDGDAQAFPISIMGRHELANIVCGKKPLTVSW